MQKHTLKTIAACWDAIERGEKTFEVRRNDRFFQRGDIVCLRRIDEKGYYTPNKNGDHFSTADLEFTIGWTLQGGQFGIEPGYIVFQLMPLPISDALREHGPELHVDPTGNYSVREISDGQSD